jgi:hypothetical protein
MGHEYGEDGQGVNEATDDKGRDDGQQKEDHMWHKRSHGRRIVITSSCGGLWQAAFYVCAFSSSFFSFL